MTLDLDIDIIHYAPAERPWAHDGDPEEMDYVVRYKGHDITAEILRAGGRIQDAVEQCIREIEAVDYE